MKREPYPNPGIEGRELEGVCGRRGCGGAFQTGIKAPEIWEKKAYLGNVSSYITEIKRARSAGMEWFSDRLERKTVMSHDVICSRIPGRSIPTEILCHSSLRILWQLYQGLASLFCKAQDSRYFWFACQKVSVTTILLL